ncbi:MAG: hypothetical protein C4536_04220 [Actinobacteria bacterium]|jgi:hypothetical protein|nr:MAG: hypothetical protein C4536_04220 [Actinomycetota bacterium]
MDWEAVIMGGVAVIWGIILFFMRPQILEFSRPGGKGLRDRKVINALVIGAIFFLCSGGTAIIILKGV